ncbi:unknown [[Mannheimia] succiniciproducens MBEL55E]|uniref:Uncharacterized protein n=1 Tax=Mannheimia succiniciproducens (strain KCTC 0769BP / MBEL55E) TaxID=221988 RepID=Q65TK3_MANSM|nr:unknown [[Mannheimia] succiniciproducens MBEL55E]
MATLGATRRDELIFPIFNDLKKCKNLPHLIRFQRP